MQASRSLALAGAVWLSCVAAAVGVVSSGHDAEREGLIDRFEARAETAAAFIGTYIDDVFETELRLAEVMMTGPTEPRELEQSATLMGFTAAVLLDRNGRTLASAPHDLEQLGVDLASEYEHLAIALAGERAVSDIVPSAVLGEPIVAFALPLRGDVFGVLSAGLSLKDGPMEAFLQRQPIAGTQAYILDSTGAVIVDARGSESSVAGDALPSPGVSVGNGHVVAAKPIPGTSWTYVADALLEEVVAPVSGSGMDDWAIVGGLGALTLVGFLLAAASLSARTRAQTLQAETDRRFRLTLEHAPIGMAMVSLDFIFVEPNARLCRMLGYSSVELEAMTFAEVTHPEDLEIDLEHVQLLLAGDIDHYEMDKRYLRSDGTLIWGRLTVSLVRDDAHQPLYFVSQIEDVTDLRAAQQDLEHRAMYDGLTGLANRGLLIDRLSRLLHSRGPTNTAVVYCDVDNFKQINDMHGHHAGDLVLQEVAQRLRSTTREDDTVARFGGDEFILLLADQGSLAEVEHAVGRAWQAVTDHPVNVDGTLINVGISGGIAMAEPSDSAESLIRKADAAMYAAKRRGRGRFDTHHPTSPSIDATFRPLEVTPR